MTDSDVYLFVYYILYTIVSIVGSKCRYLVVSVLCLAWHLIITNRGHYHNIGGNSVKTGGAIRTLQGLSSASLINEKWYGIYSSYWKGDLTYADTFTTSACKGTGVFADRTSPMITTISRGQGCTKGSQYQNVWMWLIHELEAAITDCKAGTVGSHWDEAVAFYSGSITLTNPTTNIGQFQYGLGEKKCALFNTCTSTQSSLYKSGVNEKVFNLFASGRDLQASFQCSAMETTKESLVKLFTVPLLQGVIQYLHQSKLLGEEKSKAELWSFAAAVLPLMNYYSPAAAKVLYDNSFILNVNTVPLGAAATKAAMEGAYLAMGISCADVGGFVNVTRPGGYEPGLAPCSDARSIIGYVPSSNVLQNLRLDLDQRNITKVGTPATDLAAAYKAYSIGKKCVLILHYD